MGREQNEKGEKNKKTTSEKIPGKEKAKDRREENLPVNKENDESDAKSNRDTPKAEKQQRSGNEDNGKDKPKKKNEEKENRN